METTIERQERVQRLLKDLKGLDPLKKLFWQELNYDRVNQPLSRRAWNQTAANALTEDPILFAGGGQNNEFHVVYSRLPQDELLLGQERPVVTQLLKEHPYGLFIFSNAKQDRWHFINVKYDTEREKRRLFRRISISPDERLRTAAERVTMLDLQSIQPDMLGISPFIIQTKHDEAFDVEKVTQEFFTDYAIQFKELEKDLLSHVKDHTWAHDYSLQFLNRCMFIYFIQRKGWLGNDHDFLFSFWRSYQRAGQPQNTFVDNWVKVLFFEAFCNKPTAYHKYFPAEIRDALSLAPYLNGGLFTENKLDQENKPPISDHRFERILKFLERYNFTIAEDSPLDKEVAVDPEMIGKVYESLVNVSEEVDERGEAGIFYTPRTEIDLMCRLSLVDHLANHLGKERKELLYQLVFALEPDEKTDADKAVTAAKLWPALNERLRDITVLDPACGSGSFLVGMLNILDDMQQRANKQLGIAEDAFTRKKRIIGQSLYGVDVMEWAVHVAELRLWLALIIDAEFTREELHIRPEPLLPHFTFKIRQGDSLVQEIGGINFGHKHDTVALTRMKARIDALKTEKLKFYNNDKTCRFHSLDEAKQEERLLFQTILEARVDALDKDIKMLTQRIQTPRTQMGMMGLPQKPTQAPLEVQDWKREREQKQEEMLQASKALEALRNSPQIPFVWDISFVEIFESEKEGFDIVIGNPPYVRQEAIADPHTPRDEVTSENKRAYKDKLARSVYQAFPHFFGYKAASSTVAHKINAKSDLYIYFYLHGLSLLNGKGSFCFITSNSWLDVGYGADLQEFLLKHCHVKLVLDNQFKRTFANADVNSVIVLFSAPDDRHDWAFDQTARFVMFRVPFEHIVSPIVFDEIEEVTERKATKEYRIFPIQQDKLLQDGCEIPEKEGTSTKSASLMKAAEYIGNKWGGKYLRAPDIYWTIMEKGKGKLVRLGDVATVRFGLKTGANEFFYLDETGIDKWGIEPEFLKPALVSPRECDTVVVNTNKLKFKAFVCGLTKKELKGTAAYDYICWGESQGFQRRPSCSGRQLWYELPMRKWSTVIWPMIHSDRPGVYLNQSNVIIDHNFFEIVTDDTVPVWACLFWMGTIIFRELFGRANLGQGALKTEGMDISQFPILHPRYFTEKDIIIARQALSQISKRPVLNITTENGYALDAGRQHPIVEPLHDRAPLDNLIAQMIGLSKDDQNSIYVEATQLVLSRLDKADSFQK